MKLLIVGYSRIAARAIIPALRGHPLVQLVGIASKRNYPKIPSPVAAYASYEEGMRLTPADTVYISLHNSAHFPLIMMALNRDKHVIVDKPSVLTKREARYCLTKAGKKLFVLESLPYLEHPQYTVITRLLHTSPQLITAHFGFPRLPPSDFRNDPNLGGGVIADLCPYLSSLGQYFFKRRATHVSARILSYTAKRAPIIATISISYGMNKMRLVIIGFGLNYHNHLELWGSSISISLTRAFTLPPNESNTISVNQRNSSKTITVPPADAFAQMFTRYATIIQRGQNATVHRQLFERSCILEAITTSAATGKSQHITYEA